jgi:sulfoxide reductase catalytic subunit YedY
MKNQPKPIPSSEITPESVYINRRAFMQAAGLSAAALLAACAPAATALPTAVPAPTAMPTAVPATPPGATPEPSPTPRMDERGDAANSYEDITHYNNYYEFTTAKEAVAYLAKDFKPTPWKVAVGGLVEKPVTFDIDDLLKKFPSEERIYRLRCVEGWSMVIPWMGFPLGRLLKAVQPTGSAKYVAFQTLMDDTQFAEQRNHGYPWPYTEGLRLDEAMNDLALLATGMYGKTLPNQSGAPLRLAVPWKYGFKSIKAIIKIDLVEQMPKTMWSTLAPDEYGFYANVNPQVRHPRWSQATERRIGDLNRRKTLMFNGYGDQVASLYTNMDLTNDF